MSAHTTPDKINKAIEAHFGLWWTDESKQAILAEVGAEGLARIEEMSSFANDPDLWTYEPHEQAYAKTQTLLREEYPFLSEAAILRLANSAAYGWK